MKAFVWLILGIVFHAIALTLYPAIAQGQVSMIRGTWNCAPGPFT